MDDTRLAGLRTRLAALPKLRDVIEAHGLTPRKGLGQHFLLDLNLTDKIARAARPSGSGTQAPLVGQTVVEVGPGPGGLTRSLLGAGAKVVAVERDPRAVDALADLVKVAEGCLTLVCEDALRVDWRALAPDGAIICANLPYNVATPLIVGWLGTATWPPWWSSATVMVQREVGQRLTAGPRTADYGRLGVLTGWRTHASSLFDVPPTAFTPPPKVWSSVVRLDPKPASLEADVKSLSSVTAAAFGQRRKMLRSSLKSLGDPTPLLEAAGLEGNERAETLSIDAFATLARALTDTRSHGLTLNPGERSRED
ncbi:MAG: 16S rRNA (adenine(1518)-N(6)/adenine(1519)-N(6))-dimethyltransferase RsmA [Devosia sp.]